MKIMHMEFLNELAQLLDKHKVNRVAIEDNGDSIAVLFDDYYDKLKFEVYTTGTFLNVTTTDNYTTDTDA